MWFNFFLLCCTQNTEQRIEKKASSQKVHVSLESEIGGDIEVSFEQFLIQIPQTKKLSEEEQRKLWSILHLIQSPCAFQTGSVLSSLQSNTCEASDLILQRALVNISLSNEQLVDKLTYPDFWFSHAKQGQEKVVVELWISEDSPVWQLLDSHLHTLQNATLRVCITETQRELIDNYPLPIGQNLSDLLGEIVKNDTIISRCSSHLLNEVRSSPTWFVDGFRLRGFQSVNSIQRLINLSHQKSSSP